MYFKTIRRKLGKFIFPNLTKKIQLWDLKTQSMDRKHLAMTQTQEQLLQLLGQIEEAKREIQASGKTIVIKGPVVFLGSIAACNVNLQPEIHQEFVLGQVDLQSLLSINGSHQLVTNCIFENDSKKTAAPVAAFMQESKK